MNRGDVTVKQIHELLIGIDDPVAMRCQGTEITAIESEITLASFVVPCRGISALKPANELFTNCVPEIERTLAERRVVTSRAQKTERIE